MPGRPLPPLADISFEPRVPAPQHPAPGLHTIRCLGRTPADNDDSIDCEYHHKEADLGVYLNQSRYPQARYFKKGGCVFFFYLFLTQ